MTYAEGFMQKRKKVFNIPARAGFLSGLCVKLCRFFLTGSGGVKTPV